MDTPLYNVKYYSHQPSSVDSITKYDEEFKEVTDSTSFVHIRKKPPIIQTIVLPPPPPPPVASPSNGGLINGASGILGLANGGVPNGTGNNPTTNPPPPTDNSVKVTITQLGNWGSAIQLAEQAKVQTVSDAIAYIEKSGLDSYGGDPRTQIKINGMIVNTSTIIKLKEAGY